MEGFDWHLFIRDCFQQKYVLVVGKDVMMNETIYNGDSDDYLWSEYQKIVNNSKHLDYRSFLRQKSIPLDLCNSQLHRLLKLKLFRVVITTIVDDSLERMLKEVWGDELQIINFCDDEKRNIFRSDGIREFDLVKPTLCYAFGKIGREKYAYDDDDKLSIVADWLNPTLNEYPDAFYQYIQNKKLLAIGCKLDNWLFRFFWYSLRRKVINIKSEKFINNSCEYRKGTVAIELDTNDKGDNQLRDYLEQNNLFFGQNAHVFINDFLEKLTFDEKGFCLYQDLEFNCDSKECFISYAHEDFDVAYHLYLALKERGFSVWLDTRKLLPGSNFEHRIKQAIDECAVFLPILSNTISNDYKNGMFDEHDRTKRRYYLNEWDEAMLSNNTRKVIIPILCKGFEVGDMAYKSTPWYIAQRDSTFFDVKEPISSLINGIRQNGYDIKSNKTNE